MTENPAVYFARDDNHVSDFFGRPGHFIIQHSRARPLQALQDVCLRGWIRRLLDQRNQQGRLHVLLQRLVGQAILVEQVVQQVEDGLLVQLQGSLTVLLQQVVQLARQVGELRVGVQKERVDPLGEGVLHLLRLLRVSLPHQLVQQQARGRQHDEPLKGVLQAHQPPVVHLKNFRHVLEHHRLILSHDLQHSGGQHVPVHLGQSLGIRDAVLLLPDHQRVPDAAFHFNGESRVFAAAWHDGQARKHLTHPLLRGCQARFRLWQGQPDSNSRRDPLDAAETVLGFKVFSQVIDRSLAVVNGP
mmetsp:Transcript_23592/g.50383  ORF Transcript_23592/g.50383 Transcript_23592/m.50383 type:complete len:301 (+) Transcript_23592:486-1388(+)